MRKPRYNRRSRPKSRRSRRSYKRYANKRVARSKFSGNSMRSTVMPYKFNFTTRYYDNYKQLTATPGTAGQYVWVANGLYDPDGALGGHQPIGFDNLMVFYDHYCVIAAKIKICVQNESDQHPVLVALMLSDDNGIASTSIQTLIENGACKWKRLERQGSDGSFINNMRSSCVLTKTVNIKRYLSRSRILSDDECKGNISSNPIEGVYFKVICQGIDQSADAVTISFTTQIDYVAILTEPKAIIAS